MSAKPKIELLNSDTLSPIPPRDFGLATHRFRLFDALVPNGLERDQLVEPALWSSIGPQVVEGDEVRVTDMNRTFVARLFCTYSSGSAVRMHEIEYVELDQVVPESVDDPIAREYQVERRGGADKWCVVRQSNGEIIASGHATQSAAMRAREEHLSILRR